MERVIAAPRPMVQAESRISVLLPAAVAEPFTYAAATPLPPGTLVAATLAGKARIGAVWDDAPDMAVPEARLKPAQPIPNLPPLPHAYRKFIDWVAEFTLAPRGAVLSLAGLAYAGKTPKRPYKPHAYTPNLPTLSPDQQAAAAALAAPGKQPVLLDGVTGSGKTEVYFHAIADALRMSGDEGVRRVAGGEPPPSALSAPQQILVLLPEIALTHQWLERFKAAFGAEPAVWHSRQTPAARAKLWQAIAKGEVQVVVGARSALFLPFANLSLIIVDEEHDPSYKQEDGVLYHARDMAVVRSHIEGCRLVLVSATPALETLENVREGKYRALHLPSRFGAAGLPDVALIDMVANPPERGAFISPALRQAMLETLEKRQQALLFLNRRGYAPLLLCRGCGHRFQCPDCSAWLVVHGQKRLECHHCGHKEPMPPACPQCQAGPEKLAPCGPGIERIAEEVRAMFDIPSDLPAPPPDLPPAGGRNVSGTVFVPPPGRGEVRRGPQTFPLRQTRDHARALRKDLTQAEQRIWRFLRRKHLGAQFRKQHPIGPYIADFASLDPHMVIELDGGQHADMEQQAYDAARTDFFRSQGYAVIRFWNHEVMQQPKAVEAEILRQLEQQLRPRDTSPPLPGPPSQGARVPRIAVLSSDEAIDSASWAAIERGEVDILVGTQMVAKGHHFPNLTLVGVVDADLGLDGADLRAAERSYQLLHQLGGRAGRGEAPGRVLVQTYQPNHPVMQALCAHDRDGVMAQEIAMRRAGNWPPFGQLAAILLDGVSEAAVRQAGQQLAQSAPSDPRIRVLGPAPAPLSKLRGQYRYRLLVKAERGIHLQRTLRNWLKGKRFSGVRVKLDINPYYFL